MTAVGYGDFNAWDGDDLKYQERSKVINIWTQIFGLAAFAII